MKTDDWPIVTMTFEVDPNQLITGVVAESIDPEEEEEDDDDDADTPMIGGEG